jgi:hypothetical protein
MTDISLRLSEDAVGPNGVARLAPIETRPASDDAAIAPWVDVPVSVQPVARCGEEVEGVGGR